MDESFIIANRTDVGRTREVNEDSMVTFDSPNGRVIAVCDGMGGQAAGDVASRLACDIITDILSNNKFDTPTEAITRACLAANQGILHRAAQNPELEGMGATCVMVIIKDGLVYYGWIGDSRIYYIDNGSIRQISRDQSYVQQLVDSGQITAAEAENHPLKNEILNALGLPGMTPPELCAAPLSPDPDSVIMLCSDGLSGMVDDNVIESIISDQELSLQRRADKLVDTANTNGGADNITVQLVQFGKRKGATAKGATSILKNNTYLWIGIAAVVVIAAVIIAIAAGSGKETPDTQTKQKAAVEDVRTKTSPATSSRPETKVVTTTTTETLKAKGKSGERTNKSKSGSSSVFKKGDGNGNGNAIQQVNNVQNANNKGDSETSGGNSLDDIEKIKNGGEQIHN